MRTTAAGLDTAITVSVVFTSSEIPSSVEICIIRIVRSKRLASGTRPCTRTWPNETRLRLAVSVCGRYDNNDYYYYHRRSCRGVKKKEKKKEQK